MTDGWRLVWVLCPLRCGWRVRVSTTTLKCNLFGHLKDCPKHTEVTR